MKLPRRISLSGLTPELFLVVVLPLTLALLLVTFGGVWLHQEAMRTMVGERDQRAAQAAAAALSEQLAHRLMLAQGLALSPEPESSPERLSDALSQHAYLSPAFDRGLAFLSASGQVLALEGDPRVFEDLTQNPAPELRQVMEGPPLNARLSQVISVDGEPAMYAAARGNSDVIAVGAFSPQAAAAQTLESVAQAEAGGHVFVIDREGRVIYHSGGTADPAALAAHPAVPLALAGQSGALTEAGAADGHGHDAVAAYSPVELTGWALVIEDHWESVSSPMLTLTEYAPLVLVPVALASLAALWLGAGRVIRPLKRLQDLAERLGWGDHQAIETPVGGIAEIRNLQAELVHLAHKVQLSRQGLSDYIGVMTAGQEEERRRLARELHDDTLQALIALNQRVQLLRLRLEGGQAEAAVMQEVSSLQELLDESIRGLCRLTRALRPSFLEDLGLGAALEMLAGEMNQAGTPVAFELSGEQRRLAPQVELALYRMAQEALNNVARHAQATKARLSIRYDEDEVQIDVSDNGKGFVPPRSPAELAPGGHFGLLGLYERAEMIGAALQIHSRPGDGAVVRVRLPIREELIVEKQSGGETEI